MELADPDGVSLGSQTQAFGVLSRHSRGMGRVRGSRPRRFGCLEPPSPVGLGRGRFEFSALPRPRFLTTEGLSFVACLDRSGSSDALGEFANGYDRAKSRSVVRDGVGIALL